ncbi:MAG: PilZ domain-containing protein [Terriglobales bacterium]|jgi:PilZ domain-containing protein
MGRRREPRKEIQAPVRIFGTDCSGQVFSEKAVTVNISQQGAELSGVQAKLNLDEIIGLSYGKNRVHFRVKWVGEPGTPKAGHVGLLNISPEKPLWDFPLPSPTPDDHQPRVVEQRKHPRFKCHNSVELHTQDGASFWATISDLSVGGCYVEMANALPKGTKLKMGIWIGETKCWADCEVAYSAPGFGVGVTFNRVSEPDLARIRQFLGTLAPSSKKPTYQQ